MPTGGIFGIIGRKIVDETGNDSKEEGIFDWSRVQIVESDIKEFHCSISSFLFLSYCFAL